MKRSRLVWEAMGLLWQRGVAIAVGICVVVTLCAYPVIASSTPGGDAAFCLSCHAMAPQGASFATAYHNAHEQAPTCSDCHTGSGFGKYADGVRHLAANLLDTYAEPIAIRESSKQVVAGQCFRCHGANSLHAQVKSSQGINCLECHAGHAPAAVKAGVEGQ